MTIHRRVRNRKRAVWSPLEIWSHLKRLLKRSACVTSMITEAITITRTSVVSLIAIQRAWTALRRVVYISDLLNDRMIPIIALEE